MKTLINFIFIGLILGNASLFAQSEKTFEKTSTAKAISVTNSFGDVDITQHTGSRIEVNVLITVKTKNQKDAQKYLDDININATETGGRLVLTTENKVKGGRDMCNFRINYTIKVPESADITVKNSFGNVSIGKCTGTMDIKNQHGDCYIAEALGPGNKVKVQFGRLQGVTIANADVDVQHGDSKLNTLRNVNMRQQFGKGRYSEVDGKNSIKVSHGGLTIDGFAASLSSLDVDAQFSNVDLYNFPRKGYRIDLDGSFTSFKWPGEFKVIETEKGMNNQTHIIESEGSGEKLVRVKASHGSVKIY